ncbi:2045_t:CDS:2 [Entrophospora sp. SA101]|nr:2045_t:CDS:2 [Entrophospora sp. SA101]
MNHLYKIGRTKGKGQHLEQWEKKCHYKAELIKISPDGKNDKNGWTGKGGIVDKDDDWFGKGVSDENGWTGKGGIVDEDDDWFGKDVDTSSDDIINSDNKLEKE